MIKETGMLLRRHAQEIADLAEKTEEKLRHEAFAGTFVSFSTGSGLTVVLAVIPLFGVIFV